MFLTNYVNTQHFYKLCDVKLSKNLIKEKNNDG